MVRAVCSPGLSHESRMPSTSSEEEVDELATSPTPTRIPGIEDSSDGEQDTTFRQPTQRRRPLTADERVLAEAVQAGVASGQLTLIKGVRVVLRNHKAARLEAQGIADLEDYVAKEIENPARRALAEVHKQFSAWLKIQRLPMVPISAAIIYLYAHQVFVEPKANWKHEYRMQMLTMLAELRTVANKGYESDFRGNVTWRKAFLDPIFDTPEVRALETVDRDLGEESENSDIEEDTDSVSSGEEAARNLAASSSGRASRAASGAIGNQTQENGRADTIVLQTNGNGKRGRPRSDSPNKNKRQKKQTPPVRDPSPVTAQNATTITDDALAHAMGPRRSPSKSISTSDPNLSPRSSRLGQPVQPTSPSEWTTSPASSVQPAQKPQRSPERRVIDLSMDSSDEDEPSTPPAVTVGFPQAKDPVSSTKDTEPSSTATHISVEPLQTVQPSRVKKPRPPLFPRPRPSNPESVKQTLELPANVTPTIPTAVTIHQSQQSDSVPVTNVIPQEDLVRGVNSTITVEPSTPAAAQPHTAALLYNKAVRVIKEAIAATGTTSRSPASPIPEGIIESEVVPDKEANCSRLERTVDTPSAATDVVMEGSTAGSTQGDKAPSEQQTGVKEKESEQLQPTESTLATASGIEASNVHVTNPAEGLATTVPSLPNAANSTHEYFDRWDETFAQLERAVRASPVNVDLPNTVQEREDSLYLGKTARNRQVSAFFGWHRNARRQERLQRIRQAQFAQIRSHHALQNSLGPVPVVAMTRDPQPPPPPDVEVGRTTPLPNAKASTQDTPRADVATHPITQTISSQHALTPSQRQSMSPAQQEATRSVVLKRLKPRYPDFLRDIRNPTLATGLGPVYLGSATPADLLGGGARDTRISSNPLQSTNAPTGPSVGHSDVQTEQRPSSDGTSTAVAGGVQSASTSIASAISCIEHNVQQSSQQPQIPFSQNHLTTLQAALIATQSLPASAASAAPAATFSAMSGPRIAAISGVISAGQAPEPAQTSEIGPTESRFTEITSPATASMPILSDSSLGNVSLSDAIKAKLVDASAAPVSSADGVTQSSSVAMTASSSALSNLNQSLAVNAATTEGSERSTSASVSESSHAQRRSSDQASIGHGSGRPSLPSLPEGTSQAGLGIHNGRQHRHLSGPLPTRRSTQTSPTTVMVPPERRRYSGYESHGRTVNDVRISSRPDSNHSSPLVNGPIGCTSQQQTQTPGRQGSTGYFYDGPVNRYTIPSGGASHLSPPLERTHDSQITDLRQTPTAQRPAMRQIWVSQQNGSLLYQSGYPQHGHQQAQQPVQSYQPVYPHPSVLHGTPTYQHPHLQQHNQLQQLQPQSYQPYSYPQQQPQSTWSSGSAQPYQQQQFPYQQQLNAQYSSNAPQTMPQPQYASNTYYNGWAPANTEALPQAQMHGPEAVLNVLYHQNAQYYIQQQSQGQADLAQHMLGTSQSYSMQQPQVPIPQQTYMQPLAPLSQQQTQMQSSTQPPQQQLQLQHQASASTAVTTVTSGQTTSVPLSTSLTTSNGGNPVFLDRLLATQELLEGIASKSAETLDLNNVVSQCQTLMRAGLTDSEIDYFKRRAIVLMDQIKKKKETLI